MGLCNTGNRVKQIGIITSDLNKVDMNLNYVLSSICKIIYKNRVGTGFLIKLEIKNKNLFCIMTNEYVITKEMIESIENLEIYFNFENIKRTINLNSLERIKFFKNLDITVVEVLLKDNINEDYFLSPYLDNININDKIYIPQFPKGKFSYSFGYIKEISQNEITHTASTNKRFFRKPNIFRQYH